LEKYRDNLSKPNLGKPFPELYNLDTLEPTQEWHEVYEQVKGELGNMGIDMENGWKKALGKSAQ
jgi:hypothetical protein